MPHTTTKRKRTKRPDFRPNGKRRLKAQQAQTEKDRLARVAANERKGKLFAPFYHEKLPPQQPNNSDTTATTNKGQLLRKTKNASDHSSSIRFRALHKLLRQIVALEEKQQSGNILNEAQLKKLGRYDEIVEELEEIQRVLDDDDEEEDDESESEEEDNDEDHAAEDNRNLLKQKRSK